MTKECSSCGGTGQIGFFQGVSRFLLSWEECPQCNGTGQVDQEIGEPGKLPSKDQNKKSSGNKKKN